MSLKKKTIGIAVLSLGVQLTAIALPLFDSGATSWRIWVSDKAGKVENYAAEELQTALKKISGVDFAIEKSPAPEGKGNLVIASPETFEKLPESLKLSPGKVEELAYATIDGNLYLCGNCPRGALYAVYAFLRRELDVRWFWPGDDGEYMPKMTKYELPALAHHDRPAFRFREMTPCGYHLHVPTEVWQARNLLNGGSRTQSIREKGGFYNLDGTHSVSLYRKQFKEHPDWFCLVNGKRVPEGDAGCWSNPEFTKYIVEKHLKMIKDRKLDIVNAFPADSVVRCECPECTKNPDPSSRWYDYYAKLIELIRKESPDTMFAGIAYQEYRNVPKTEVKYLEYLEYCQYNRCYVHKLNDPNCKMNKASLDELKRWQKKTTMGIYGYEFDIFRGSYYVPFWNMLQDEVKVYRDMKLSRMKTELGVYPDKKKREDIPQIAFRLSNYIYAQLVWNPDLDMDKLLDDFSRHVYGPAGDILCAYHKRMAAAWDAMKIHLTYFGNAPAGTAKFFLNDELIKENAKAFKEAIAAVQGEGNERYLKEVLTEQALYDKWVKLYQASRDNASVATIHLLPDSSESFQKVGRLPMKTRAGEAPECPTEARIFWSTNALHIQVMAMEPDMASVKKGSTGVRDVRLWHDDNVEIFIATGIGEPYYQFAVNLAGGTYDAINTDKNWDPAWQVVPRLEKDRWVMDIRFPFTTLGTTPKAGDQWQIIVNRNNCKGGPCGYPRPAFHDMGSSAVLLFSDEPRPDKRLIYIGSPDFRRNDNIPAILSPFQKRGWQTQGAQGVEKAMKLDWPAAKMIVFESYKNAFSKEFYEKEIVPAVTNGAVLFFSSYFWVDNLARDFADPTFEVKFIEDPDPVRRTTWVRDDSFATTPHNMKKKLGYTPSGVFKPAFPEKWTYLASQKLKDGTEWPYLLARPVGKGMLVLGGDLSSDYDLIENLFEYNKAIKRD